MSVGNTKGRRIKGAKIGLEENPGHLCPFDPLTLYVEIVIHLPIARGA
jgi:hypothetical protein